MACPDAEVSAQYRDERRAHILAAARRCFVRDGFHQTSRGKVVDITSLTTEYGCSVAYRD